MTDGEGKTDWTDWPTERFKVISTALVI